MKILGLCGSLREGSANARLLGIARVNLGSHEWSSFPLDALPYFDPDRQFAPDLPDPVRELRALASAAGAIFLTTPEYAHGVPGIVKNALEWTFHEGTQKKPFFAVVGSGQGESTRAQLLEILPTMDFLAPPENVLLLKGARALLGPDGGFRDAAAGARYRDFCLSVGRIG